MAERYLPEMWAVEGRGAREPTARELHEIYKYGAPRHVPGWAEAGLTLLELLSAASAGGPGVVGRGQAAGGGRGSTGRPPPRRPRAQRPWVPFTIHPTDPKASPTGTIGGPGQMWLFPAAGRAHAEKGVEYTQEFSSPGGVFEIPMTKGGAFLNPPRSYRLPSGAVRMVPPKRGEEAAPPEPPPTDYIAVNRSFPGSLLLFPKELVERRQSSPFLTAVRHKPTGTIIGDETGYSHFSLVQKLMERLPERYKGAKLNREDLEDGFIDRFGQFHSRKAMREAGLPDESYNLHGSLAGQPLPSVLAERPAQGQFVFFEDWAQPGGPSGRAKSQAESTEGERLVPPPLMKRTIGKTSWARAVRDIKIPGSNRKIKAGDLVMLTQDERGRLMHGAYNTLSDEVLVAHVKNLLKRGDIALAEPDFTAPWRERKIREEWREGSPKEQLNLFPGIRGKVPYEHDRPTSSGSSEGVYTAKQMSLPMEMVDTAHQYLPPALQESRNRYGLGPLSPPFREGYDLSMPIPERSLAEFKAGWEEGRAAGKPLVLRRGQPVTMAQLGYLYARYNPYRSPETTFADLQAQMTHGFHEGAGGERMPIPGPYPALPSSSGSPGDRLRQKYGSGSWGSTPRGRITINPRQDLGNPRFTMSHELGHGMDWLTAARTPNSRSYATDTIVNPRSGEAPTRESLEPLWSIISSRVEEKGGRGFTPSYLTDSREAFADFVMNILSGRRSQIPEAHQQFWERNIPRDILIIED